MTEYRNRLSKALFKWNFSWLRRQDKLYEAMFYVGIIILLPIMVLGAYTLFISFSPIIVGIIIPSIIVATVFFVFMAFSKENDEFDKVNGEEIAKLDEKNLSEQNRLFEAPSPCLSNTTMSSDSGNSLDTISSTSTESNNNICIYISTEEANEIIKFIKSDNENYAHNEDKKELLNSLEYLISHNEHSLQLNNNQLKILSNDNEIKNDKIVAKIALQKSLSNISYDKWKELPEDINFQQLQKNINKISCNLSKGGGHSIKIWWKSCDIHDHILDALLNKGILLINNQEINISYLFEPIIGKPNNKQEQVMQELCNISKQNFSSNYRI